MRITSPSVSVIMPVFNAAAYVEEAVTSILEHTFSAFELILIDDGSSDETPALLDRLAGWDARIRLVHQANAGLVAALNLGLSLARGRYLARMDADDRAYPERLAEQFAFLEKHPAVAVLGGSARLFERSGRMIGWLCHPTADHDLKALLRRGTSPFVHPTVMLRRDVLVAAGGYAAGPYLDAEDFELWNRLSLTHNLANLPAILLDYRVHSQSVSWTRVVERLRRNTAAWAGNQGSAVVRRLFLKRAFMHAELLLRADCRAVARRLHQAVAEELGPGPRGRAWGWLSGRYIDAFDTGRRWRKLSLSLALAGLSGVDLLGRHFKNKLDYTLQEWQDRSARALPSIRAKS